jgi:phosphatase NudJ
MQRPFKSSVTVAAIIEKDGLFLLVEEETANGLKLNNPAGHLDPGETPVQGCMREALEESAYAFQPTALLGIYLSRSVSSSTGHDVTYLRLAFRGELGAHDTARKLDRGIVRTLWLTPREVRESAARHRSPLVLRCMEDYLAGMGYPLSLVHTDASVLKPREPLT